MKSGSKKTTKIFAATAVTLFSLVTVFVATIAWFAMNENVGGNGMSITTTRMDGKLKYVYFHSFDDETPNDGTFSFSKTPFATYQYDWDDRSLATVDDENANWDMGSYSSFDKNHPMLVIFAFDKDYTSNHAGDFYIQGKTTVNDFLGRRQTEGEHIGAPYYTLPQTQVNDEEHPTSLLMAKSGGIDYYALSSVASFRYRTFTNSTYSSFLSTNSGDILDIPVNTLVDGHAFNTVDNAAESYTFDSTPKIYESNGTETVKYIALTIEYSADAIGFIYSTYLGDSGLNNYDSVLHFTCDWLFEVA